MRSFLGEKSILPVLGFCLHTAYFLHTEEGLLMLE